MRSHKFAPLTRLMYIKKKLKWKQVKQDAFGKFKRILARNALSTYPDFNETLKIHTDSSVFQVGVFVSQKGKPIYFYSIKLTYFQQ